MNEKQTEEHTDQEESASGSYSLDESPDMEASVDSELENSDAKNNVVMILAAILVLIAVFFVVQALSGSSAPTPEDSSVASEAPRVYEYVKVTPHDIIGDYLTDMSSGLTLYTLNENDCPVQCMKLWVPYVGVEELAYSEVSAEYIETESQFHYAWKGEKLYYYAPDSLPGDMLGDGFYFVGNIARP
jgi:predicted lipoprotein with Yx(FWY)xxD motif